MDLPPHFPSQSEDLPASSWLGEPLPTVPDGPVDPSLGSIMDLQLRQLGRDLAEEDAPPTTSHAAAPAPVPHDATTAEEGSASKEDASDDLAAASSTPSGPLSFQNLVHPPASSNDDDDDENSRPSSQTPGLHVPTPGYTPGPFNPYPDPSAPQPEASTSSSGSHKPSAGGTPDVSKPYKRPALSDGDEKERQKKKRAEQNRAAQKAFRERRDARIADLEAKAQELRVAKATEAELSRKLQLASNVIAGLRKENDDLKAALEKLKAESTGDPALSTPPPPLAPEAVEPPPPAQDAPMEEVGDGAVEEARP